MDRQPADDIRRYHPSPQEQSILTPNLKLYFSYPERSPDRSRISAEVAEELSKFSNHWTNRTVRLWFNNNKKLVGNENKELVDSGTEPEVKKSSGQNDSQSEGTSGASIGTTEMPMQTNSHTNALRNLEDEAAWVAYTSPRMQEIVAAYNSICFSDPSTATFSSLKSANYIEFPAPPPRILPFAINDLLNKNDIQIDTSIWKNRNFRSTLLPPHEANCITNGYGAYVSMANDTNSLSYTIHPEFSTEWKVIQFPYPNKINSITIGKKGDPAWMVSGNTIIRIALDTTQQNIAALPVQTFTDTHIATGHGFVAFVSKQHNTIFFSNDTMQVYPVQLSVPYTGISNICVQGEKIVCAQIKSTTCSLFDQSGKEIRPFIGHRAQISEFSSISENIFCTCSFDNCIKIWDVREPRSVATFFAGGPQPTTITSSTNYIMSGYSDGKIRAFDIRHKQAKACLGVDLNRQYASTISFNDKLDALSIFTSSGEDEGYWKDSPDLNYRFTILSPFIRL